jgi:Plavaka transposase
VNGNNLPPHTLPPPPTLPEDASHNPWHPFQSRIDFDFAYYHFVELQSSEGNVDKALDLWAASVMEYGGDTPWNSSADLYRTIDAIQHGDAPWKVHHVHFRGPLPPGTPPKWMTDTYELCMRDARQVLHHQLATPDYAEHINYAPYRQLDRNGKRIRSNLMSANWAWTQAVSRSNLDGFIHADTIDSEGYHCR